MKPIPIAKPIPIVLCLLCVPLAAQAQKSSRYSAAERKVIVAGVPVGGLDQKAMTRRLKRELKSKGQTKVTLSGGAVRVVRRRADLGIEPDLGWMIGRARSGAKFVPLRLRADQSTLTRTLKRMAPRFKLTPRNARLIDQRGRVRIAPDRAGQTLNVGASGPRLAQQIAAKASDTNLKVVVRKTAPRLTRQRFKGINGRLATFSTEFNAGNVKRTLNMRVAIRSIDGTLVAPGKTFSLNDTVGERTQKRGYRTAIIFENGRKEPGIGGGVSQVTGTLFNAALLSGLPIVTYQTHSRPVTYIPIGRDATVSWGDFDMKWKNNTPAPIYISYKLRGDTATATLYGRRVPGQKVRLRVVSKTLGSRKITANLYRTILRNGKVVRKEKVGDSDYNWKEDKKND